MIQGTTDEKDLPESRTEFNEEEYGSIELPSVNRLKAMFGQSNEPDSSIRRVCIIFLVAADLSGNLVDKVYKIRSFTLMVNMFQMAKMGF